MNTRTLAALAVPASIFVLAWAILFAASWLGGHPRGDQTALAAAVLTAIGCYRNGKEEQT